MNITFGLADSCAPQAISDGNTNEQANQRAKSLLDRGTLMLLRQTRRTTRNGFQAFDKQP